MWTRLKARYQSNIKLPAMKMNRIFPGAICGLLLVVSLLSCKSKNKTSQAVMPVQVTSYTVQTGNVTYYDTYPGVVVATNEVQIRSEVSGYITGIFFREGSEVAKGTKLYEIDRRKYQAAYEEARAAVEIAKANLDKARRDAERYRKLDEQKAIAKQILDDGMTAEANAEMQLKSTEALLLNAETDYNYSLITAPFSGSIGFSQVKPGAFVNAGQTLLNTISSDDPIGIDFTIDEKSLPYFHQLQNKTSGDQDSTFRLILPDNSEYRHSGRLSIIDRAVDPQTGTIKIRTVFPNFERNLRPGMNCKIKVLNENSGLQINIPVRAIVEQMSEFFVYVIDGNIVKQRRIEMGPIHGEFVVVKTGLASGDKIVLEGSQKVHEGTSIVATEFVSKKGTN